MFPTSLAGSLPKPAWLAEQNVLWPKWRLEGAALAEGVTLIRLWHGAKTGVAGSSPAKTARGRRNSQFNSPPH